MVTLRLFGSLDLVDSGGRRLHTLLAQPKVMAVLAYLATARPGELRRRDALTSMFWPDLDNAHARSALRTALHRMRQGIGDVLDAHGAEAVGLRSGAIHCDATELAAAHARRDWTSALASFRGEFLAGFHAEGVAAEFEEWVAATRRESRRLAAEAVRRLAAEAEADARWDDALAYGRRAVAIEPADERAVRQLIALQVRAGDRAGAWATYAALRNLLQREFGAAPSPETTALVTALRSVGDQPRARRAGGDSEGPAAGAAPSRTEADAALSTGHDRGRAGWLRGRRSIAATATLVVVGLAWWGVRILPRRAAEATRTDPGVDAFVADYRGFVAVAPHVVRPMSHMSVVLDAGDRVALVFGGMASGVLYDEVWAIRPIGRSMRIESSLVRVDGPRPRARAMHSAAYDSLADAMIVFGGGLGSSAPCTNETWILDNAGRAARGPRWRRAEPVGPRPSPRGDQAAAWIPSVRHMVVHGGHDCVATRTGDTWAFDAGAEAGGGRWTPIGLGAPAPSSRSNHTMVYDQRHDRIILFGGVNADHAILGDVWILEDASTGSARWKEATVRGPLRIARYAHGAAWDAVAGAMLVFGGADSVGLHNDVWALRVAGNGSVTWTSLDVPGPRPAPRNSAGVVFDAATDRLVIIAGQATGAMFTDLWQFVNVSSAPVKP